MRAHALWEAGHRVVGLASWPGTIRPAVSDSLVSALDVLPTFLAQSFAAKAPFFLNYVLNLIIVASILEVLQVLYLLQETKFRYPDLIHPLHLAERKSTHSILHISHQYN